MSQSGPSPFRKFFSKKVDEDKVEEEILSMVEEGHEQGVIEEDEMELINNIFEFSDKKAKDIMTSRQRVIALEENTSVKEAIDIALENQFSRYPVYGEELDNIVGLVHIKDLMAAYMKDQNQPVSGIMDKPMVTHPNKDISELLHRMQIEKIHMAVVVDEYGQTDGIVAMEDIIEEIVGNIFDEHDEVDEEEIKEEKDGVYRVEGHASLEELAEIIEIEFPDEDFGTVNGFLLYELGRIPEEGENIQVVYQGYEFISDDIKDNVIQSVEIKKVNEKPEEE